MKTADILKEINRLPVQKRIYIIEKTLHTVLDQKDSDLMVRAAEALYNDYNNDDELTAFSDLG